MTQLAETEHALVLSAAPHGASAQLIDQLLTFAESQGVTLTIVDASADFRFSDPSLYAATYGHEHRAPARLGAFRCSVPEHLASIDAPHAAHPGCFATAMLLAIVPLLRSDLSTGEFYVSAVTGSTGAGRSPRETTHHPVRQSTVFAYQPLVHRHAPEVRALAEATAGVAPKLHFVPHSGPFARGIHATVFAPTKTAVSEEDATELLREFYRGSQFVLIEREPPRLKDVVASNYARLSASTDEGGIVVCCVLDNLVKGAAGGSIQWANRLLGLT
jgi:N-acetyl-gamma-glutamyl-phosphate reductase